MSSLIGELLHRAWRRGARGGDAIIIATATVVGWNEHRTVPNAGQLFARLGTQLDAKRPQDGLRAASDWLNDPGLSSTEWEAIDDDLRFLQHHVRGPVDWNAEVASALTPDIRHGSLGLSPALARSITRVLDFPINGSFACLFPASASVAWALAGERDVTLFADQDIAIVLALLARAACRPLKISRQNPLDGSFMPAPYFDVAPGRAPPFDRFDHIFTAPPFGPRINIGTSKGLSYEAYQIEQLASRATKSFTTLIPDGVLFRETKFEAEMRRELVKHYDVTIMSLPPGMYWPATAVSTSLVHLEPGPRGEVRVIDGRSMEKTSSGRAQEALVVEHLERYRGMRPKKVNRTTIVEIDELADCNFSFVPDRYLKSGNLARLEKALVQRPVVALTDIATIERNKAPLPIRRTVQDPPLTAMEIVPADIVGGLVLPPSRQVAFELTEEPRVRGVTVQPGDILVSIKGNVGIVGLAGLEAQLAESMSDPWIVSQSLAIVRWKPNTYIPSPTILHALLTAPWVREKLENMSGATTVRSLPISALRSLTIPIPTGEQCAEAESELAEIESMREKIAEQQQTLADRQRHLWAQLWQVPADLGNY